MKNFTLNSKILKGALLLVLMATCGVLKAQTMTINNNANCSMKVFLVGHDACSACHAQNAVIVGPNSSTQVTPTGNGCTIDDLVGAKVKATCDNASVTVGDIGCTSCMGSYPNTDSFTLPGTCCGGATITVNADCSGSDITITIDD